MFAHLLARQISPWCCTLFPRVAEAISSPTLLGFYGPAHVIRVHAGTDAGQGTRSPAAFPACRQLPYQCAGPASNPSSGLVGQKDTLGKSTCDSWVREATGRCSHTTGCSRMAKSKRHREVQTPAQQEHEHVHFQEWCVGSRELKGSRAPFPPGAVPGRLPTTACMRGGC